MTTIYNNPKYNQALSIGNLELTPLDLFQHIVAFGGTGSGKTRSCVLPTVESVLKHFGNGPEERAALILLDAKGDMVELAAECIRRSGRKDKILVLGDGGNCWLPIFEQFQGDASAIANFLFETLEDHAVTVRERDSMAQERIPLATLEGWLDEPPPPSWPKPNTEWNWAVCRDSRNH